MKIFDKNSWDFSILVPGHFTNTIYRSVWGFTVICLCCCGAKWTFVWMPLVYTILGFIYFMSDNLLYNWKNCDVEESSEIDIKLHNEMAHALGVIEAKPEIDALMEENVSLKSLLKKIQSININQYGHVADLEIERAIKDSNIKL